ncbi:CLUMA_CG008475, isoform A [Clunio marinus]|uniref:CLUMA_CG008475, isoform A n=1 Tax=Clunio marinus TaxID=568069 RepID=A0A1J1I5X8_9DIPT|nr:CLUMA_CG008475, isoform A [Clunio marinus]
MNRLTKFKKKIKRNKKNSRFRLKNVILKLNEVTSLDSMHNFTIVKAITFAVAPLYVRTYISTEQNRT